VRFPPPRASHGFQLRNLEGGVRVLFGSISTVQSAMNLTSSTAHFHAYSPAKDATSDIDLTRSRAPDVRYEASSYGRSSRCPRPAAALFTVEDRIIKVKATIGFAIANIPD
jgi:hypothetical protein